MVVYLNPSAYLAIAVLLHLHLKGLSALRSLHSCNQVNRKDSSNLDWMESSHQPISVEVNSSTVGVAFVIKVEHFLPNSIAVVLGGLIETFFLKDASLHFIKKFLFWHRLCHIFELVEVLFPSHEFGMAFAWKGVNQLFESFIIKVVYFYFFEEGHK